MSILGSIVKAVSSAVSSAYKKKASSGSGSSSNSNKSNNSSSSVTNAYTAKGTHFDATAKNSNTDIYDKIAEQGRIYNEAKAAGNTKGMEEAHKAAEAYRASLGYSGGEDGSGFTRVPIPIAEKPEVDNQSSLWDDYLDKVQKQYDSFNDSIAQKNALAVQQGTARLEAQKSNINQTADNNARQAYVNMMMSKKALPQQLASQGVTGGATETANLGLSTNYQNNVNNINQNKANAIQEIDNAIVDLKNTGDLSTVEQVLANNQQALAAQQQLFAQQQAYNQWANEFNANRADVLDSQEFRDKQYADQMAQQAWENEWYEKNQKDAKQKEEADRIIDLMDRGIVNTNEAATLFGVPVGQINSLVDYIKQKRTLELKATQADINNTNSLAANRNSGGGSGGTKNTMTYKQVFDEVQGIMANNQTQEDDLGNKVALYDDNTKNLMSARLLLNSDLTIDNGIAIMKQLNVKPEAFVREMSNEGYSDADIKKFITSYTSNVDYGQALFDYAKA